jgi:restriction system protein
MYQIEIRHKKLNKYRHIRGSDKYIVQQKAEALELSWKEMWKRKQSAERKRINRATAIKSKEEKKQLAITQTEEAQVEIKQLETILAHTLKIDNAIDWNNLTNKKKYSIRKPIKKNLSEPKIQDDKYKPSLGFFDKLFSSLREKKENKSINQFKSDHNIWKHKNKKINADYSKRINKWENEKYEYEEKQSRLNKRIEAKKKQYLSKDFNAITDYCETVLANSQYPDYFPQSWEIDYKKETKILIIDYSLPNLDSLPTIKTIKYIISRDELTQYNLSNTVLNKLYDSVLYQITLRTIHELYEADVVNAIDSIVFNGWVESTNKATGHDVNACIMSIEAPKNKFLDINLEKVDPKLSFKQLKGIGSSKLYGLSPIAPIANINKEDRRFVSAYEVIDGIDEVDNLAAMDWQDFEHLIREIFEKEFSGSGGEVKITQASRDGGVDAIAFDPDPIRGGKIVIQAKRYTNVVGVSAVRDLFGTTVNEGAIKGILVTTADYGPDAYEFIKGKPLTLLNGGELLHLLEKHGHKAKIDLKEAKKILAEKKI